MVGLSIANGMPAGVHIGVSPLSWVNEVLADLGEGTATETILRDAKEAGFQGVELSRIFPSDPSALNTLLGAHDLQFISGWYSGFLAKRSVDQDLEDVRKHASLLKSCGAKVMVYGECGHMANNALDATLSSRQTLAICDMAAYGARLTQFAEAIRDEFGLALVYHHHLMMVAETLDEIRAVMAHSGSAVGLLLDTGHAVAGGFDYALLLEEFGPRIRHIHLKDVRADIVAQVRARDMSFNDGVRMGMFTIPGDGSVDFVPLAQFIASSAYSGWIVVEAEQDPKLAPPAQTVARAYRYISNTFSNEHSFSVQFREPT